ncbi:fibronectin type III domain-containing protein [Flavobacterium sp.]|uniref:fibronectin type III domain-containing protein n=1 Tax=Flavobacterium sp. TaxID=239 RepID=UPI0039E2660F
MKKIILLFLVLLSSSLAHSQGLNEKFESAPDTPDGSGVWTLTDGNWLVTDNVASSTVDWQVNPDPPYPAYEGVKCAFVNRENLGNGGSSEEWLITPQVNVTANQQLRFFTRQTLAGDSNQTIYEVRVSSNANQANLNAYTVLASYTETQLSLLTANQLDWEEKIINLGFTGMRYFAFVKVYTQQGAATNGDRWLIDNVKMVQRCVEPTVLTATNISSTGATVGWTGSGSNYTIEYGPQGFTPGTGTIVSNVPDSGPNDTYVIPVGSLTPDTCYQFYVTAHCGSGETGSSSLQTGPFNFCTEPLGTTCAGPIVIDPGLPYFTSDDTNNYGNGISGTGNTCGTSANFLNGNDVVYSWTNTAAAAVNVNIQMNPGSATNTGVFVYSSCANITSNNCLAGVGNANATIREIPSLSVAAGATIYVVVSSTTATPSYTYTLALQIVNCPAPVNGQAVPGTIGMTDAQLSWANGTGSTSNSWDVVVQPANAVTIPTVPGYEVNGTPQVSAALAYGAPLTSATGYVFWVRADCGNGTNSLWSGPYAFATKICEAVDQCNYTFTLTDSFGDGWNGATMQVRQGNDHIVVATLGTTFTTGGGPIVVTVPMCNNLPFDLYWNAGGGFPGEVRISIKNSFGQTIYAMTTASGALVNTEVYSGTVDCLNPLCLTPTALAVPTATVTSNGAVINWTSSGVPTSGWDLYVVPQGTAAPLSGTPPTYTVPGPTPTYTIPNGLLADQCYDVYIRSVCTVNSPSVWTTTPVTFCTLPTCPKPTNIQVPAAGITLDSANITWTAVGAATGYQVAILPSPSTLPIPEVAWSAVQTGTTYPASGLNSGTLYDVYVRSICLDGGDIGQPSAPVTFNTIICLPEQQCNYTFTLTDSFGDGWNNARMQVRQNGIVVATLGANFTGGAGPVVVNVPLCHGVPFDLYWSVAGGFPGECRIAITNNFGQQLYAMTAASAGLVGTVLYEQDEVDCLAPLCLPPTVLTANPSIFDAVISWTPSTFNTAFDVYIVTEGSPAPDASTIPTYSGVTGNSVNTLTQLPEFHLNPSTTYVVYVRAICDANSPSIWTPPTTFTTLPTCPQPINLMVDGTDTNSATLTWTEVGPATQWAVYIVPSGSPAPVPGTDAPTFIVNGAGPTITLNTLTGVLPDQPGAPMDPGFYQYYVVAQCTETDHSTLAGPVNFFILNSTSVCPDVIVPLETPIPGIVDFCPGEHCFDLTAEYVDFKDTTTYIVDAVPFAPPFPFVGGTELNITTDDIWGPPVTLPFDFCFFGVNSQSVQVGSNGVVTFTPQAFPGNCPWAFTQTIPNANFPIKNAIYGVYQDINPNVSTAPLVHSINYQVLGTAPCRSFVVNYYQVAQFSCGTTVGLQTSQIVLYETSNIVEVYVQDRTVCTGWNSGSGVIGIQNAAGTQAHFPPGRNTGPWETHNEAWRFTPNGDSNVEFTWLQGDSPIGNGSTDVTVCFSETTLMTARATYTGCGGDQVVKEVSVLLRINEVDIEPIEDVVQCECYVLPALEEGQHYYTATGGPNGTGTEIAAGTSICDPSTTIFVYAASNTEPPCSDEEEFNVTINLVQAPTLPDVTVCESYTLPPLEEPYYYFEQPDGGGQQFEPGAVISTPGPIYILGVVGECLSQSSFTISIGAIEADVLADVTDCNGFILPELSANNTYHSEPGGTGATYEPGTNINQTQIIYIYAQQGTCIDESQFTVTVQDQIIPTFEPIANICVGGTADPLPTSSTNVPAINGTWNPLTIDTSVAGTFDFTFTPDGTIPCAVPTTIQVTIDPLITPAFTQLSAVCVGGTITLPTQSNDQTPITGTWSPAPDNTQTTEYTFTPDAGQGCATTTTMTVVVNTSIIPTFNPIAPICAGDANPLPATSNGPEFVTGTWTPVFDPNLTTEYTFIPDPTLFPCADANQKLTVTVNPIITPSFSIAAICAGDALILPTTSNGPDAVTGTWSPTPDNTQTTTYTFTPDAGQGCTVPVDVTVVVNQPATPVFTLPSTICTGDVPPVLPATDNNGIPGTWSPLTVDNTLSQVYTFTPNSGQCAVPLVVNITVLPSITPTFNQLGPICAGDALVLPAQSTNGINGIWTPAVDNTQTMTYTFNPAAGQCAAQVTMTVVVNPIVVPSLTQIGAICSGSTAPTLSPTDLNGVSGTWSPAQVSNTLTGTYTFTPDPAIYPCAESASIEVTVNGLPAFTLTDGCINNDYTLSILSSNFEADDVTYAWTDSNGSPIPGSGNNPKAVITTLGTYYLTVNLGGCTTTESITPTTVSCTIQRGISPGDGSDNDFFDLAGLNVRRLEIFNRYGTKVYSKTNYSREWYGQSDNGNELPDGTYFYVIERDGVENTTGWIYINRVK